LIAHLYLGDMWFGVAPRTGTKETCIQKKLDCIFKYDNHSKLNNHHN
jgi:hypothetical protein